MPTSSDTPAVAAYDADVIVVGAGPVGLSTGCALRHHGIDCPMLEERTALHAYSRANNLWARPQELLAGIGLRDALAKRAYAIRLVNVFMKAHRPSPSGSKMSPVHFHGSSTADRT